MARQRRFFCISCCIFCTDTRGVDVFAQMVHGTTIALLVGFVSMGIAATIGIVVGAIAGYAGGWPDMLLSRAIEVVMCVPALVLILALLAIVEQPSIWHMMAVIGCTSWTGIARLTRAEFLKLKQTDFVAAARVLGNGRLRIIFRHILPNALAPVLVPITFGIAAAILIESGLSFLGFGAPPEPELGHPPERRPRQPEPLVARRVSRRGDLRGRARLQPDRRGPAGSDRPAAAGGGPLTGVGVVPRCDSGKSPFAFAAPVSVFRRTAFDHFQSEKNPRFRPLERRH